MDCWKSRLTSYAVSLLLMGNFASCTHLAFQPSQISFSGLESMPGTIETFYIVTDENIKLGAWWIEPPGNDPVKGCVLQFHGNAQNRTTHAHNLRWMVEDGFALFAFDYRGYGDSQGSPTMSNTFRDNQSVLREFLNRCRGIARKSQNFRRIVIAQSLGGYLSVGPIFTSPLRAEIDRYVLESTFSSLKGLGQNILTRTWLTWPLQWLGYLLVSNENASKYFLPLQQSFPILVVHGTNDPVVPYSFGEEVYKLIPGSKEFLKIPNGQHIDSWFVEFGKYRKDLLRFLGV